MFEVYLFLLSKGLDFKAQFFYMFQKNWLSKHMFYFFRTGSMFKAYFFRIFQRNWFPKNLFFSNGFDVQSTSSFYIFQRNWFSKHGFYFFRAGSMFKAHLVFPIFRRNWFSKHFFFLERVQCSQHIFFPHFPKELIFYSRFLFVSIGFNVQSTSSLYMLKNLISTHIFFLHFRRVEFSRHILFLHLLGVLFSKHTWFLHCPTGWIYTQSTSHSSRVA